MSGLSKKFKMLLTEIPPEQRHNMRIQHDLIARLDQAVMPGKPVYGRDLGDEMPPNQDQSSDHNDGVTR